MTNWILAAFVLVLLAAEWHWRLWFIRLLITLAAAGVIVASRDLGPAARQAIGSSDRVTTRWGQQLNPYVSGVLTMKRESETSLREVTVPVVVLVWLSVSPLLPAIGRRPVRTGPTDRV